LLFCLLSLPRYPADATSRTAPTNMVLPDWMPSLENRNMSSPMRMPVASLTGLVLSLRPHDWVTQSRARGAARRMRAGSLAAGLSAVGSAESRAGAARPTT